MTSLTLTLTLVPNPKPRSRDPAGELLSEGYTTITLKDAISFGRSRVTSLENLGHVTNGQTTLDAGCVGHLTR